MNNNLIKSKQRILEHGEVFTSEREVNSMLDLVKQETKRIESRFLEPACGDGNFLSEILNRKLKIVKRRYGESQKELDKYSLVAITSLYGIELLEDNVKRCKERLYKIYLDWYKSFSQVQQNIKLFNCVKFVLSKNVIHGDALTLKVVGNDGEPIMFSIWSFTQNMVRRRCFPFDELFKIKFDVIIGNPPYQLDTAGHGRQAKPIYNKFIEKSKKLKPKYIVMITPSRWFSGGMGLEEFRRNMLEDKRLHTIVDFTNSKDCFPGVSISGGVNYFLWDSSYEGKCTFVNNHNSKTDSMRRYLNETPILIRYNKALGIINKIKKINDNFISDSVKPINVFGLGSAFRGKGKINESTLIVRHSKGIGYLKKEDIKTGIDLIYKYKVAVSRTIAEHAGEPGKDGNFKVLAKTMILKPNQVCTHSYLVVELFDNEAEAKHLRKYLHTKFVRFLILIAISGIDLSKERFRFVPTQKFKDSMSDEILYNKYKLNAEEIKFIETMIRPMELGN
ncbi:MAG: hypothetical protein CMG74_09585 [Candidatus Marinimicrobia bacterium]|nr:hypothetical protein [Candidatus Neomarinimicrobiota bacterium]|tara:strand:- start:605 stop:2119 length:1515 start_codon:yes stop_codon:yes gene_type:complete